ncbi:MAG: VRR-NUC domain-containing protein [Planctomycetota bacterium]
MPNWTADDLADHYRRLTTPPEGTDAPQAAPVAPKGRKPLRLSEEQVQRQITDLLEAHGWLVMRTNKFCGWEIATQGAIEPGMPDLQARKLWSKTWDQRRGVHGSVWEILWIEVKRPGGKVSLKQATWHQLARKRGETVLVAMSVEEVAKAIGVTL